MYIFDKNLVILLNQHGQLKPKDKRRAVLHRPISANPP